MITHFVDMEIRLIIELLPDRYSGTIKKWLIDNPRVEIITRPIFQLCERSYRELSRSHTSS
ncbi:hypothetical protein SAMN05661012_06676 [Chitinophaga sancti]|uniref:Uncharacterized protein n=1 Tax=Chitinophaga sancti TaxID=1004 RepID=A0A1K1T2H1_9BACT|nr:hypothetical protein SAMN05661012_06676 [Chitinophaga sancti]